MPVDAAAGRRPTDAGGLRRRAGRHLLRPREPVARDRPLLVGPPARVLSTRRTGSRAAARPGSRRSTSSSPTAAGPPTRWRRPPATDRWWCSAGSTATPSTRRTGRSGTASCAPVTRCGRGRGRPPSRRPGGSWASPCAGLSAKDLKQADLAQEYAAAEVFAVGSWFEGFGQPALEAMASRCPARHHRQRWQPRVRARRRDRAGRPAEGCSALADGLRRVLDDRALGSRLSANALELVAREFDWETAPTTSPRCSTAWWPIRRRPPSGGVRSPTRTPSCRSSRSSGTGWPTPGGWWSRSDANTDVPYELIIVDNGSEWEAASYACSAADRVIANPENRGFATGMNQGLEMAKGDYIAFCNNDIVMPPGLGGDAARDGPRAPEGRHHRPGGHVGPQPEHGALRAGRRRSGPCRRSPHPRARSST